MATLIPDPQGTVTIKGYEKLAEAYKLKNAYTKLVTDELGTMKEQMRQAAELAFAEAAPGTKRVLFRDGKGGGVEVSKPDLAMDGNRPYFSQSLQKEITKFGGLEQLGEHRAALDETTQVTLTGQWAEWFMSQLESFKKSGAVGDAQVGNQVKAAQKARITQEGISVLEKLTDGDDETAKLAKLILDKGIKSAIVGTK